MPATDITDVWRDLWLEYHKFFTYYQLDEMRAASVVYTISTRMQRPDPDRVADALKEFAIRAQERGTPAPGLVHELRHAEIECGGSVDDCCRLFGTAAEDLGQQNCMLLAQLVTAKVS